MDKLWKTMQNLFVRTKSKVFPYYAELDVSDWENYSNENGGATMQSFLKERGTRRLIAAGQTIPDTYIGVEKGWSVKLRLM